MRAKSLGESGVDQALLEQGREGIELRLSTPGGRFQVRWDEGGSATALGQLAFFAAFFEVSGLFERWVGGCPLAYTSPNAPAAVDVRAIALGPVEIGNATVFSPSPSGRGPG